MSLLNGQRKTVRATGRVKWVYGNETGQSLKGSVQLPRAFETEIEGVAYDLGVNGMARMGMRPSDEVIENRA